MRYRVLLSTFIFGIIAISCNENGLEFSVEIKNYAGAEGITIYYIVTNKSVHVDYVCDQQNCKRKTLYKRDLDKRQSDSIYRFIQSLHLDTLKSAYKPDGIVFDGLVTYLKLRGSGLPNKSVTLDNQSTPATDSLFRFLGGLVPEKFRNY
jgi:hypothetical protein